MITLEPYTYYRNTKEQRAFLLVDCPTQLIPEASVVLIEWGKTRDEPIRLKPDVFKQLLQSGLLELFTPKFQ